MGMDLETATTRLYEEPSLTEDLIDEEATTLLKWAEQRLPSMINQHPDEEAFEAHFKALRSVVKGVNRLIGQRQMMDDTERSDRMQKIVESLHQIGLNFPPEQATPFLAHLTQATNNLDSLNTLLNMTSDEGIPATTLASPERLAQIAHMGGASAVQPAEDASSPKSEYASHLPLGSSLHDKDNADGEEK